MRISKIYDDFQEVNEIFVFYKFDLNNTLFHLVRNDHSSFTLPALKRLNESVRNLYKLEGALELKKFQTEITRKYVQGFIKSIKEFLEAYDNLGSVLEDISFNEEAPNRKRERIERLKIASEELYGGYIKIVSAKELLGEASLETWEPIPEGIDKSKVEVIIISSDTKGGTLGDIARDIACLDGFLNMASQLMDTGGMDGYFLRKIETGSLQIVISLIAEHVKSIVSFLLHCEGIVRKVQKQGLENRKMLLEEFDMELDIAKKIFEIDPDNKAAVEIVQKCGAYVLEYMQRNPAGSINGKKYDTRKKNPGIEQKDEGNPRIEQKNET